MFNDLKPKIQYCIDTISVVPFAKAFVGMIALLIIGMIERVLFNHCYVLYIPILVSSFVILVCAWHLYQNYIHEEIPEKTFTFAMHVCVGLSVINQMKLYRVFLIVNLVLMIMVYYYLDALTTVMLFAGTFTYLMICACRVLLKQCNMQYMFEEIAE